MNEIKKKRQHWKWVVPLVGFIIFAIWAYSSWMRYNKVNPLLLIPSNAIYILESAEPLKNWDGFHQSPFWDFLSMHPSLEEVTEDADYLDSLINANRELLGLFGDNHFIMSAHMTSRYDYDFLFAFDLKNSSHLALSKLPLQAILGDGFEVREQDYLEHPISQIKDLEDGSSIFLCQLDNYLLTSFYEPLLHACIDHYLEDHGQNEEFEELYKKVGRDGLCQLYLNHQWTDEFLFVYCKSLE